MADSKMADAMKQFALNITTSKVKERRRIFSDVKPCVDRAGSIPGIMQEFFPTEKAPQRTTVERNAVELGLLSDMMAAEALYNTPNVTLCFDASTQEGVHFNTLHITTESESILLDVEQLAGDLPEAAVRTVFKYLLFTLSRYHDSQSRNAVEELLFVMASKHPKHTLSQFNVVLTDVAESQRTPVASSLNAGIALNALAWSSIVVRTCIKEASEMTGSQFSKMVQIQCLLLNGILSIKKKPVISGAYNRMRRVWREIPGSVEKYAELLCEIDPHVSVLCMVTCMFNYLSATKQRNLVEKYKGKYVDIFVKQVVMSRTSLSATFMENCGDFLRQITHDDFKSAVLPAIGKGMLRNPEVLLQALSCIIGGVSLDLSCYAVELGKHLTTHLHSKDEQSQSIAVSGCRNLAKQCSDAEVVVNVVKHMFAVLNGSEGKLTIALQRVGMLSGIGAFSQAAVTGQSGQDVVSQITEAFIPVLKAEIHESTLIHALAQFTYWCAKFASHIPEKITNWFKSAFDLKSSTPNVRNAYIQCMNAAYRGDTLCEGLSVLPLLLKSVEKAAGQVTSIPVVIEALSASCLLAKLSIADEQAESQLAPFWKVILNVEKQIFVNDRFLAAATSEALMSLATLAQTLILQHPDRLSNVELSKRYHYGLVYAACGNSYTQRKHAYTVTNKLLSILGGASISVALVEQYAEFLAKERTFLYGTEDSSQSSQSADSSASVTSGALMCRVVHDTLCALTAVPVTNSKEGELIALKSILTAHHPAIVHYNNGCWTDIVAKLKIDAKLFIEDHIDEIMEIVYGDTILSEAAQNTIGTLVRISPELTFSRFVQKCGTILVDPRYHEVTREDCAIMNWTEGELYDRTVIERAEESKKAEESNMRRENKAYSYKEQLAMLELQKEIDKKKKLQNKTVKLTKKQQESVDKQLKLESQIRKDMLELDCYLSLGCDTIHACIQGNAVATRQHLTAILDPLRRLVNSPLASTRVCKLFIELARVAFSTEEENLALSVGYLTLRLLEPACELDSDRMSEPVQPLVVRSIEQLQEMICGKEATKYPATSYALMFPMLSTILYAHAKWLKAGLEATLLQALQILSQITQLRGDDDLTDEIDEYSPDLLPRLGMFSLLMNLVRTTEGRLQQESSAVVQQLALSASGMDGCALAEHSEINVVLQTIYSPSSLVREIALKSLHAMVLALATPETHRANGLSVLKVLWISKFDVHESNRDIAEMILSEAGFELDGEICTLLVSDVSHHEEDIRTAASAALANALLANPQFVAPVIELLLEVYQDKLYMPPPLLDSVGRQISETIPDQWQARAGVATATKAISGSLKTEQVLRLFQFYVEKGLKDRSYIVGQRMLDAAIHVVNDHGKKNITLLQPMFEEFLKNAPLTAEYDVVRQGVIIMMGTLAKHLETSDRRVEPIVLQLLNALSTPSQEVQESVSKCLPPLVPAIKERAPKFVADMLETLKSANNYAETCGAAYGLSGMVKGLGILSLKQLDIMSTLTQCLQGRNTRSKEGALFAFEMLCLMLGRLFEPYVVHILPDLLLSFGDTDKGVRQASHSCAKAVMSKLSAHGVKLILPSLLNGLDEDSFRTKVGAIDLLGSMAYCAPKQLSACLPSIVPRLIDVSTDSHHKVQQSASGALKRIGSVIKNPEIEAIVPQLLSALEDPASKTTKALYVLLETKFVHFIDAPSLALIMPVVTRAFEDRSTQTRKMSAQIIGSMYSLTDQKDLAPYLPAIIPGLKNCLLDPEPEVRAVSAKALGFMVRGVGESNFDDLMPWLMSTLTDPDSAVDRSGAAQGLSEVVGALGISKLKKLMPDIISTSERSDIGAHVRDGYMMMYIYLPMVFGDDFVEYVGPIIPSILKGLSDETEFVRDTALRAGQRIVITFADTAVVLLLPQLEKGLVDDNWRIRYSSIQLLGDLLYKISGVTGKMSTESAHEDDNFGTEQSQEAILKKLGEETRDRVLASLYIGRSDTAPMVRQSALHVWKIVVTHTPKMLRTILPRLFQILLGLLANNSHDKRKVAARTLGDLVKKLGEKVLPEIIPILKKGLKSEAADQRQGVCIGLTEIMASTSRDHVIIYADSLIPTVRQALCDDLPEVRESAASTFDNLHSTIGERALDDIIPRLLERLENPETSASALHGLIQMLKVKSRVVMPYLIPQLTKEPVNTHAIALLAPHAGGALTKHLTKILSAMMSALSDSMGTEQEQIELDYCKAVVLSAKDDKGMGTVIEELLQSTQNENISVKRPSICILQVYCEETKIDYSDYVPMLLKGVIHLFIDEDTVVLEAAWNCLNSITKKMDPTDMQAHIGDVRQAVRYAGADCATQELPGFCMLKKGITPILPIYREGILNGSPDLKESSAIGLGEVINRTSANALRPSVVNITGPLIRVLGDRFPYTVKVAVLKTLTLLLTKCGAMLKPFLPQLQTTFVKALNDPQRSVRLKSATALAKLIVIHVRVDPLFNELNTGIKSTDDSNIRETFLQALRGCIIGAGAKMDVAIMKQILVTLESYLNSTEDTTRTTSGACLGALCGCMEKNTLSKLMEDKILDNDPSIDWTIRHGRIVSLFVALKEAPQVLLTEQFNSSVIKTLQSYMNADRTNLITSGLRGAACYLSYQRTQQSPLNQKLLDSIVKCMKHDSNDVKQIAAMLLAFLPACVAEPLDSNTLKVVLPSIVNGVKEKNTIVRSNCELAVVETLQLRNDDDKTLQSGISTLQGPTKDLLNEYLPKLQRKIPQLPTPPTIDTIDDTILV